MATSQRNLRRIVVGGVQYEWRAHYRSLPVSASPINVDAFESELVVYRTGPGGRAGFLVRLGPADQRAVSDGYALAVPVTPRLVRVAIEFALMRGWDATRAAGFRELAGFAQPSPTAGAPPSWHTRNTGA